MMSELRNFISVLDEMGIIIKVKWLSSTLNRYAGAFSHCIHRGGLRIFRTLRHSVVDGIQAPFEVFS